MAKRTAYVPAVAALTIVYSRPDSAFADVVTWAIAGLVVAGILIVLARVVIDAFDRAPGFMLLATFGHALIGVVITAVVAAAVAVWQALSQKPTHQRYPLT